MKTLYILEAIWHDALGRCKKSKIIGVYDSITKVEIQKQIIEKEAHSYNFVSFSVAQERQLFSN